MQLRAWRKANKLTLVEAGKLFGLEASQLSRLETGQYQAISVELGMAIKEGTKGEVTIDELFETSARGPVAA